LRRTACTERSEVFGFLPAYHQGQNYQKSLVILIKYLFMSGLKHPVRHNAKQHF